MPRSARRRLLRRIFQLLFLAAGVALLVHMLRETDGEALWADIRRAGWWFLGAFGAHAGFVAMGTASWWTVLRVDEPVPWPALYGAFWTGEALNYLFPGGAPGEIAKGVVLNDRVPAAELTESLTIYNLFSGVSIFLAVVLSGVVALVATDLPPAVPLAAIGTGAFMLLVLFGLRLLLRRKALGRLLAALTRLPLVDYDPEAAQERVRSMDARIRRFRADDPRRFRQCLVFMAGSRVFETLEVYALAQGLMPERPVGWLLMLAFLIYGATMVVLYATLFVPGQIGAIESGTTGIFQLLGLSPTVGLALELLRRGRKLLSIAVMGLGALILYLRAQLRSGGS